MSTCHAALGDLSIEFSANWRHEGVLVLEEAGAGDVGPMRIAVRAFPLLQGDTVARFAGRVVDEARTLPGFALVESRMLHLAGFLAIKTRVRFAGTRDDEVVATTSVFLDTGPQGVLSFVCSTTRRSEAARDAVTAAQWAALESIVGSLRVRGAYDDAPTTPGEDAFFENVPLPWDRRRRRPRQHEGV